MQKRNKITIKKKRGQEFINPETNSDKELWDDIDSKEDEECAKEVSLQTYIKPEKGKEND